MLAKVEGENKGAEVGAGIEERVKERMRGGCGGRSFVAVV
jgi:hypothetical protein